MTEFYNRNNVINDDMNRLFAEVYTDSKKELDFLAHRRSRRSGAPGKEAGQPVQPGNSSFSDERDSMAGWNPNMWYSMAKQLEKGERDIRDYTVRATKQLRESS